MTDSVVNELDIYAYGKSLCKNKETILFKTNMYKVSKPFINKIEPVPDLVSKVINHQSLLKITGSLQYEFFYNSTPAVHTLNYWANNYHILNADLQVTYKDKAPFRVRFSNLLNNYNNQINIPFLNISFNSTDLRNQILKRALGKINFEIIQSKLDSVKLLKLNLLKELDSVRLLDQLQINSSQNEVEKSESEIRESICLKKIAENSIPLSRVPNIDTVLVSDTLSSQIKYGLSRKNDKLINGNVDSILSRRILGLHGLIDSATLIQKRLNYILSNRSDYKKIISDSNCKKVLIDLGMLDNGIDTFRLKKGFSKVVFNINSLSFGKKNADYSDLTVKNISVNGLEIDYGKESKIKFSVGLIDNVYRSNYLPVNNYLRGQFFTTLKTVIFKRKSISTSLILFTGQKQLFNYAANISESKYATAVAGFSVIISKKITEKLESEFEYAKSSNSGNSKFKNIEYSKIFSFRNQFNDAYNLRINYFESRFAFKSSGYFRYIGSNYKSFSIFNTGVNSFNWGFKVDKSFFRKVLTFSASIRTNEISNEIQDFSYNSRVILKTFQFSFLKRNYPSLIVGYIPSIQIFKTNTGEFISNSFYSLFGNANYSFRKKNLTHISNFTFSRTSSLSLDSSQRVASSLSISLSHELVFSKTRFNLGFNLTDFGVDKLFASEVGLTHVFSKKFSFGLTSKANFFERNDLLFGGKGIMSICLNRIGKFQFTYGKGLNYYIVDKKPLSMDCGYISFIKTF